MKNELRVFLTSVMFYTRIPCPSWVDHSMEYLNKSSRYFPLIGWIVGGMAYVAFYSTHLLFGTEVAILLSIAVSVYTTGAFHEDGFADVCDGFGGGWTSEQILTIMKDSRLGTYGAIGLFLILLLKFYLTLKIVSITEIDILLLGLIFIASHSVSRLNALSVILTMNYAQLDSKSKVKPIVQELSLKDFFLACFWAFLPLVVLIVMYNEVLFILVILPIFIARNYLNRLYKRKIGGYTGDCLGATQQVSEVIFLCSFIALWNFM